jgi:hypothetical protein
VNHEGKVRFDFEKKFQWAQTVYTDVDFSWRPGWGGKYEGEFEISLMYGPSWNWAAGLMWINSSLGLGGQFRF